MGNAGNAADTTGYGSVAYSYNIGKYEVTAGQYTAFLNAVAATDTYGLYNTSMSTDTTTAARFSGRALRAVTPTACRPTYANRPVNYVSFGDAMRFANWLQNGQPTGAEGLAPPRMGRTT